MNRSASTALRATRTSTTSRGGGGGGGTPRPTASYSSSVEHMQRTPGRRVPDTAAAKGELVLGTDASPVPKESVYRASEKAALDASARDALARAPVAGKTVASSRKEAQAALAGRSVSTNPSAARLRRSSVPLAWAASAGSSTMAAATTTIRESSTAVASSEERARIAQAPTAGVTTLMSDDDAVARAKPSSSPKAPRPTDSVVLGSEAAPTPARSVMGESQVRAFSPEERAKVAAEPVHGVARDFGTHPTRVGGLASRPRDSIRDLGTIEDHTAVSTASLASSSLSSSLSSVSSFPASFMASTTSSMAKSVSRARTRPMTAPTSRVLGVVPEDESEGRALDGMPSWRGKHIVADDVAPSKRTTITLGSPTLARSASTFVTSYRAEIAHDPSAIEAESALGVGRSRADGGRGDGLGRTRGSMRRPMIHHVPGAPGTAEYTERMARPRAPPVLGADGKKLVDRATGEEFAAGLTTHQMQPRELGARPRRASTTDALLPTESSLFSAGMAIRDDTPEAKSDPAAERIAAKCRSNATVTAQLARAGMGVSLVLRGKRPLSPARGASSGAPPSPERAAAGCVSLGTLADGVDRSRLDRHSEYGFTARRHVTPPAAITSGPVELTPRRSRRAPSDGRNPFASSVILG